MVIPDVTLHVEETDDPAFARFVLAALHRLGELYEPVASYVVRIDNWFSQRWLRFSHKCLGSFGVASSELVIPPFVPNRVVSEDFFGRLTDEPIALHRHQTSSSNASRRLKSLVPQAALFWWSGGSKANGRGSLMAYLPTIEGHVPTYVELKRGEVWSVVTCVGVDSRVLREILNTEC